jgi:large subunit ribosomal protein L21
MDYAIIRVGNKQHRVRDGETLVVDRIHTDEGGTFQPEVLLGDSGVRVTATVVAHERGPKIRIGKYKRRTGYKRHTGFRAATTRIEVTLGAGKAGAPKTQAEPAQEPPAEIEAADVETAEVSEADEVAAAGLPEGYEAMTVATIHADAKSWSRPELEAALAYEQEHAGRKGALHALETALAATEEG